MKNFLSETVEKMINCGYTDLDITFIGTDNGKYECNWKEFKKLSDKKYNSGLGSVEIPCDLVICFKDGVRS